MPAEPTQAKLKRRASRKELDEHGRFDGSHARELEQKRIRGEVSCAECRRLKIKCDKQIPCQSCQRRGCAAICPTGSLSTGQGTRFVLAATEHLHRRITSLSARIRLLEDALMSLEASHPLSHPEILARGDDQDSTFMEEGTSGEKSENERGSGDVLDAFGTLSISDHGISRFFGPTGGVESLFISKLSLPPRPSPQSTPLVPSPSSFTTTSSTSGLKSAELLALFSSSFPFTPLGSPEGVQGLIASHLPSYLTAKILVQTYLQQCSWLFHGVTKEQLEEMVEEIYSRADPGHRDGIGQPAEEPVNRESHYSGPHDLALLFIIFAVGALVQPSPSPSSPGSQPPSSPATTTFSSHITSALSPNALGEHYYQISRAALALQPVLEKASLVTIQTLHLMSIYNAMSGSNLRNETSMEVTWSLITLAAHLSMTIGLHRDSAQWGLTPKMVQRRQILFWDLFVADVWQSLNTGRPPSFSLAYIDCSFPDASDHTSEEAGFGSAFSIWQCRFAAECVAEVTARTLTAEAPTYATIMELDKKVREFPLPSGMGDGHPKGASSNRGDEEGDEDLAWSFQKCVLDHIRETVLMYIHRSFFAQAIIEHPTNPLKSPYAPSFLAAYRAATTILKSVREQFSMWPISSARFWTMWTFAFSAAIVFGTVVTRGPKSPLAQSAMHELEQAYMLFSRASEHSIRASQALPILAKLVDKARNALATAQEDPVSMSDAASGALWNIETKRKKEDDDDELSIFAGHTRFISAQKSGSGSHGPKNQQQRYSNAMRTPEYLDTPSESSPLHSQPPVSLHYPYASSERPMRDLTIDTFGGIPSSGWDDSLFHLVSRHQIPTSHERQGNRTMPQIPQHHHMTRPPQFLSPQFYSSPSSHKSSQQTYSDQQPYGNPSYLQQQPDHSARRPSPQHTHDYRQTYLQSTVGQIPLQQDTHQASHALHPGNVQLANLGLAARDSRLDERWSSFMQDSGILEDIID